MLFFSVDINFFKEYIETMKPVCQALDILQGENDAYTGILLPTITTCIKKLDLLLKENKQIICLPLAAATKNGLLKRFENLINNLDYILASALHPHFKLKWLHLLSPILNEEVSSLQKRIFNKIVSLLQASKGKTVNTSNTTNLQDCVDSVAEVLPNSSANKDFFDEIFTEEEPGKKDERQTCESFLQQKIDRSSPLFPNMFDDQDILALFCEYNTAVPSSAAVERLFSLGKDVLKPKRAGLSDKHFEMLVFLKEKCA